MLELDSSAMTLFVALFLGTFVSEDATCLLAGGLVAAGETSFALAVASCIAGIFAGDVALYGVGRLFGPAVFQTRLMRRFVSDTNVDRAHRWLEQNVGTAVITSRFISGLRLPVYLAAGVVKADAAKFVFWFLVASFVWTPLLVGAAALSIGIISPSNLIIGFMSTVAIVQLARTLMNETKRRLLVGRLTRIVRWEFWPVPVFYVPVIVYIAWLAVRNRSLTVFTGANPGMPAGGFVGESKDRIYESTNASQHLPSHVMVRASEPLNLRILRILTFMVRNKLTYPVALKPDIGERGKGVQIIHDREQLGLAIKTIERDVIVQEYCPGVEASVFYYRFPSEINGRIFSITEKRFPFITGDGRSTVKELILGDDRAVCMAKSYFKQLEGELDRIPTIGEQVTLIDIGTHSRGAIFLEGEWLRTARLKKAIDEVSRSIDGFYFGRYDIRASSFEDLMAGNFKIIELNGVTSESTNIYDPRYSLLDAYRILFRQWRLAFEIGSANIRRGYKTVTLGQLARLCISRDASPISHGESATLRTTHSKPSCA